MKGVIKIYLFFMLFLSITSAFGQAGTAAQEIIDKINNAEKIEHLYSARYNLDKLSTRENLSVVEMRSALDAHLLLTKEFKARNHFRNAVDVYIDYLKLSEVFNERYSKFLADSLQQASTTEVAGFKNRIEKLDSEITRLKARNAEVSGLRNKYLKIGGISTAIILAIFFVILFSRNKEIRETNKQIEITNQKIKALFSNVVNTGVLTGSVYYTRSVIDTNYALTEEMIAGDGENPESKTESKIVSELNKLKEVLAKIYSAKTD